MLEDGKEWKFCTKCKCRKTDKVGIYQLSHFDSEHVDNYTAPTQGNFASVQDLVPLGVPATTTKDPLTASHDNDDDDITFVGAWCAPVVSFTDPPLPPPPPPDSPYTAYPSSDESIAGAWCAPVTITDAIFVAAPPVEREILVDDPTDFQLIDPFLAWMSCKCDPVMTCIDCNTDWREQWEDYLESIKPLPLWPSSKELLNETALAFLRAAEPTMSPLESFELAYEDECISVEHDGLLFYDPEPIDGVLTFDNAHTLARFLRPRQWRWFHDFMLAVFE